MKKIVTLLLALALALSLCACPALDTPRQVHITVGKLEPGMTIADATAEVTIDSQPLACQLMLIGFEGEDNWLMGTDETIPENFYVRLDIYYTLPKDCQDMDDFQVTVECDGGTYDDTFISVSNGEGCLDMVTQVFYGKEIPQPSVPATQDSQPHTHNWEELPGPGIVNCTLDSYKNYKCSCGETKTETIPAPGHDLKDWHVTPATCTQDGRQTTSCKRCGAGFVVEIPATGHTWSAWVKKTGLVHSRTCSVCGEEEEAKHNIPSGGVTCTDCGADIIN